MTYNHGDRVTVYDRHGNVECRGKIAGRHQIVGGDTIYDIQPDREFSMTARKCGIPAARIRRAGAPPAVAP